MAIRVESYFGVLPLNSGTAVFATFTIFVAIATLIASGVLFKRFYDCAKWGVEEDEWEVRSHALLSA